MKSRLELLLEFVLYYPIKAIDWLVEPIQVPCKHGFKPEDVINLKVDPLCQHCNKKLSEICPAK